MRGDPWVILHHGGFIGTRRSRRIAMNAVDRGAGRVFGDVRIYHRRTGEEWVRRAGSWFKSDAPAAEVARAGAGGRVAGEPRPAPPRGNAGGLERMDPMVERMRFKMAPAPAERGDPGPRPSLAWLPVERLEIDPTYQRRIDTARSQGLIERIAAGFCWSAFQAVLATPDGDGWKLIDGQHRVAAARLCGLATVPAVIIEMPGAAEQAAAFVRANRDRARVDDFALHRAALLAGDEDARRLEALATGAGITIPRWHPSVKWRAPGEVAAIAVFRRLLNDYPAVAADAVGAVADAYRAEVGALRAPFFMAAAVMLAAGTADRARLTSAFRQTTGARLYAQITARRAAGAPNRAALCVEILQRRLGAAVSSKEIGTAVQGPGGAPPRASGADGRAAEVDAPRSGTRTPEKVPAGGEAAKPRPSSQGGQIASAGASLIPRVITIPAPQAPPDPRWPARMPRFEDSAKARADHGSPSASRELGHSPSGSSLGGIGR